MIGLKSSSSSSSSSENAYIDFYYPDAPTYELSLDEFESFALSRLVVLRKLEEFKVKSLDYTKTLTETKKVVTEYLPTGGSAGGDKGKRLLNEKRDQASHFILRLAYCRTEELRRWFLQQETGLFKFRLEELERRGGNSLSKFMKSAKITFDKISDGEKAGLSSSLRFNLAMREFESSSFYKIPFAQATDLIMRREVYVMDGFAYVPSGKLVSIVTARFRSNLSRSLAKAAAAFSNIAEDSRIGPLLKNMNRQYTGRDFGKDDTALAGELTAANIDDFAKRSMPLCMRQTHEGLKKDHKLKHDARRQYGLFLKAAGLSMEESLLFFQNAFTKLISSDDFNKNYAYNIRHMYGKEGKRQSYTAFSCTSIIMGPRSNPNEIGSHHGCPFAHNSDSSLNALLSKMQIGPQEREAIISLKKSNQYGLACAKHFEVTHPGAEKMKGGDGENAVTMDGVGNHPNGWFLASTTYWKNKDGNKAKAQKNMGVKKEAASPMQAVTGGDSKVVSPGAA